MHIKSESLVANQFMPINRHITYLIVQIVTDWCAPDHGRELSLRKTLGKTWRSNSMIKASSCDLERQIDKTKAFVLNILLTIGLQLLRNIFMWQLSQPIHLLYSSTRYKLRTWNKNIPKGQSDDDRNFNEFTNNFSIQIEQQQQ